VTPAPVLGAVLAGGRASRMGRPKEGVRLKDGRAMIEPVLEAMVAAFGRVVVVGACTGFDCRTGDGIHHLQDLRPGQGPLAGLEALLASGLARGYVVAACDQPLLTSDLLRMLGEGAGDRPRFFRTSEVCLDPLPGYFPAGMLGRVSEALADGRRAFRGVTQGADPEWLPVEDGEVPRLASANSFEDLAAMGLAGVTHA
jgi:molybdenum cofactor guanylyltransferase